jgi:enterochelin esterase-like enzyme
MSLTGTLFLGTLVVVTVAAFAAAVLLWPSLGRPGVPRVAGRVGILVGLNALVLLTAGAQLNAQFLFFADWTDLRGAFGGPPIATALSRGTTATRAARTAVHGAAAVGVSRLPPLPSGRVSPTGVITYTVRGAHSGLTGTVEVQLPPGYQDARAASIRYPVMEAFQGYPGGPGSWIRRMALGAAVTQQVAAGQMRQTLVVSPQVELPKGVDTEGVNGAAGRPQVETWLARDVPEWVARTFRVRTDRASWSAIGFSTGGWCAAMVAMLHPAQYSAAIVMGGYFRPEFGALYEPYPPRSPLSRRYDLVALSRRSPPPVAIWLETSHADSVSYSSSAAFLKATRSPLSVKAVVLQHAGHRIPLWQGLLPSSLAWLGHNVPGFGPAH